MFSGFRANTPAQRLDAPPYLPALSMASTETESGSAAYIVSAAFKDAVIPAAPVPTTRTPVSIVTTSLDLTLCFSKAEIALSSSRASNSAFLTADLTALDVTVAPQIASTDTDCCSTILEGRSSTTESKIPTVSAESSSIFTSSMLFSSTVTSTPIFQAALNP